MSIASATAMLTRLKDAGELPIVGYSGGKDSLVCLDLVARVWPNDPPVCFLLEFLPGLAIDAVNEDLAKTRFGATVHRLPHPDSAAALRASVYRRRQMEVERVIDRDLTWNHIEAVIRGRTGRRWIIYGHRMSDSLHRRGMLKKAEGCLEKFGRLYPLWNWEHTAVFAYLRSRRLPIPGVIGGRVNKTGGVGLTAGAMAFLREHWPEDYAKILSVFPQADTIEFRDEIRRQLESAE